MSAMLEIDGLIRHFDKLRAVDDISFNVKRGQVFGFIGPNGAGKTTTIKCLLNLLRPQAGTVRVFGFDPQRDEVAVKSRLAYVPDAVAFYPWMTVRDTLNYFASFRAHWNRDIETDLMKRFGLPVSQKASALSRGQKTQLALITAICPEPELLVLDEPAGGLDPVARREFLETAIQLLNREGTAILFSSHNMTDVERIGGRVVLLDKGRVRIDRDLDRIREQICVAMIPRASATDAAAIERIPGCLRVRPVYDEWHAVMEGEPETVSQLMMQQFGGNGVRCTRVPLEELFIELVGGER